MDLVPRSPLNSVQIPAKAASGRSSLRANQTTSFFLVSGFGSGAWATKYSYYLQRGRAHWILWLKIYDDNWGKWETPFVTARLPLKGFHGSAGDAAIILLTASLVDDKRSFGLDSMGIDDTGLLSMDELNALLDTLDL